MPFCLWRLMNKLYNMFIEQMFDKYVFLSYHIHMEHSVCLSIMFEILREPQTAKNLAEEFEISTRTVYRYIDYLCGAGVPIVSVQGRYGGFKIIESYRLREFFLTRNEKNYLLSLLSKQQDADAKTISLKLKVLATL